MSVYLGILGHWLGWKTFASLAHGLKISTILLTWLLALVGFHDTRHLESFWECPPSGNLGTPKAPIIILLIDHIDYTIYIYNYVLFMY